jgi:drug/metabolite transporter (DMT)-like permease
MVSSGILLGLLAAVAFGLLEALIAIVSRSSSTVQTVVLVQATSVPMLFFSLVAFFKSDVIFSPESFPSLLLLSMGLGLLDTVANVSLCRGLALGPVAIVSLICASDGLVTTLLALFISHDTLSLLQGGAICLVFSGTVLAMIGSKGFAFPRLSSMKCTSFSFSDHRSLLPRWRKPNLKQQALLCGLAAMFSFGIEFFVLAGMTPHLGPIHPILWARVCSVILLLIYARHTRGPGWQSMPLRQLVIILLISLLDTAGMVGFCMGTSQDATSIIATLSSTYILIPIFLGVVLYHERLMRLQWIGVSLSVAGIVLLSAQECLCP